MFVEQKVIAMLEEMANIKGSKWLSSKLGITIRAVDYILSRKTTAPNTGAKIARLYKSFVKAKDNE